MMPKKENKINKELEEWKNTALRLKADYENREKEIAKEKSNLRELVEENLILEFLPVLDNLNSALKTIGLPKPDSKEAGWVQGVIHICKQFEDILSGLGIEKMDLLGSKFDPALAEAVDQSFAKASDGKGTGEKIVKVVLDGYKKGDRVIRAGRVVVGE